MGQSLSQLYVHITFSTKGRQSFIQTEVKDELHRYLAGILKKLDCPALIINSMPDHIHILFRLSKNYALAKVVEEIKKGSSKWMKTKLTIKKNKPAFSQQIGYSAFSVSSSRLNAVQKYISDQEKHHKEFSFKEEIERFMKEYNLTDYNPKYFWNQTIIN